MTLPKYRYGFDAFLDPKGRELYIQNTLDHYSKMLGSVYVSPSVNKDIFRKVQQIISGEWHRLLKEDLKGQRTIVFKESDYSFDFILTIIKRANRKKLRSAKPNQRRRGIG